MLGACITFGLLAPVSKSLFGTGLVSAYALTMMRMGGGAVVFWIASLFTRREHVPPRDLLLFFFASLLGIVLNQGTYVLGVSKTSPIDASDVTTTTPIFVMIIAALYLREPITGKKILGVVVGAAGALLLILSGAHLVSGRTGSGSVSGDLLCLFAQLSFATYFVVFKKLISRYSPVTLMKWMFLYATACCLPFGYSDLKAVGWAELGWTNYAQIAYVVLGATFLAYLLMPIGQKNLRPTVASSYNYVQPLVATLVAVSLGLDTFGWLKGVAVLLVFAGVYIVTISKSRAQLEAEAGRGSASR